MQRYKAITPQHDSGMDPYYVQALDGGYQWHKQVITYTFSSTEGHFSNPGGTGYATTNDAQQNAIRAVLQEYAKVANISFHEIDTSSPSAVDIVFRQADLPDDLAGWGFLPSDELGSDVVFDTRYNGTATGRTAEYYGIAPGQFGFRMMLHEIGHAMGLEHPFEGAVKLPEAEDSQNATVMSYNGSDQNAPSGGYVGGALATRYGPFAPQTLMIYDIATIQTLYGANHAYHASNDTYQLTGVISVSTLWDGAGLDTLSSVTFAGDATLELREGLAYVSNVGNTHMWNAFGANIENATGGGGNDIINGNALGNLLLGGAGNDLISANEGNDTVNGNQGNDTVLGSAGDDSLMGGKDVDSVSGGLGNDSINGNNDSDIVTGDAGDDLLRGGKESDTLLGGDGVDTLYGDMGNDRMAGGADADIFVFAPGSGVDTIIDFQHGADVIEIAGYALTSDTIAQAISGSAGGAVIALGAGASVTLSGVDAATLDTGDFLFG